MCICTVSTSLKLTDCRWNFSVGQHDVAFVSRKSAGYDSTPHGQYRDRIAPRSSHHVDGSCTKSTADSVKYRNVPSADQDNEHSDQCEVQSESSLCFHALITLVVTSVGLLGKVV